MSVHTALTIAEKSFRAMKANTSKEKRFYTQGQQLAARVLLIVWLLASGSPESTLANPRYQPALGPATTTSPGDPSLASTPSTPLPRGTLKSPPESPDFSDVSWDRNASTKNLPPKKDTTHPKLPPKSVQLATAYPKSLPLMSTGPSRPEAERAYVFITSRASGAQRYLLA